MNAWQILGIPFTSDQRAIKRAYAKQLKQIDQDQNPEDFLLLRNALEQALYEAEYLSNDDDKNNEDFFHSDHEDLFRPTPQLQSQHQSLQTTDTTEFSNTTPIEQLYQQLEQQLQQQYAQSSIQNTLIHLKPLLANLSTEAAYIYLEKIAYLLYINDLENLFNLVEPPTTQETQVDLYNIPNFDDLLTSPTEEISHEHQSIELETEQTNQPRHEAFGLFNIPVFEDKDIAEDHLQITIQQSAEIDHIEQIYQQLSAQLQQSQAHFSIHDALYPIPKILMKLDLPQQELYRQKFFELLSRYGQEKWFFFIFEKQQANEIEITQTHFEQFPSSSPLHLEHELTHPAQSLTQRFYWLEMQLQAHVFNDDVFRYFSDLLTDLQNANLQEQIEVKQYLEHCLANLDFEQYPLTFGRFILLWDQYYPLQDDCLNAEYFHEKLLNALDFYQNYDQIFTGIPENLHTSITNIMHNHAFSPIKILILHRYLRHNLKIDSSTTFFNPRLISNPQHNTNYIFLSLLNMQWTSIWWVIWGVICFIYIQNYFNLESLLINLVMSSLLFLCSQILLNIIAAKILSTEHPSIYLKRLSVIWFLMGIVLCASPIFLPHIVLPHLYYLWIFFTFILFKCAQYSTEYAINLFFNYSTAIKIDPWIIALALMSYFLMFINWMNNTLNIYATENETWLFSLFLIPIGFLLYNSFFKALYQSFSYQLNHEPEYHPEHTPLSQKQILANTIFIVFRVIVIFLPIYFFVHNSTYQSYLYLSLAFFCSLFLLSFATKTSYFLVKYLSYLILIIGSMVYFDGIPILAITFLIYFVYTIISDIRHRQTHTI